MFNSCKTQQKPLKRALARHLKMMATQPLKQNFMKKFIAGLALQLTAGFAGAFNHQSELTISATGRNQVSVSLDNNPFGSYGTSVDVSDLEPGYHYLVVYKKEAVRAGHKPYYDKFVEKVVYNGYIEIPVASRVRGIANYDRLSISIQPMYANHFYNNNYYDNVSMVIPSGMSPAAFAELKNVIANRWFDSGKLQVAMQAIAANPVTSAQLAELMQMLSFDSSRLELAKAGYASVIDRQNFFLVNNAFSFESSIDELQQFIRNS